MQKKIGWVIYILLSVLSSIDLQSRCYLLLRYERSKSVSWTNNWVLLNRDISKFIFYYWLKFAHDLTYGIYLVIKLQI